MSLWCWTLKLMDKLVEDVEKKGFMVSVEVVRRLWIVGRFVGGAVQVDRGHATPIVTPVRNLNDVATNFI